MSKGQMILDNEGNEVRVGDEVIASINFWQGKDEAWRAVVTSVGKKFITATFRGKSSRRVKHTKFIRVRTAQELEIESYQGCQ